jgi:hypothetical protein
MTRLGQRFYNFARGAQGHLPRKSSTGLKREAEEAAKRNGGTADGKNRIMIFGVDLGRLRVKGPFASIEYKQAASGRAERRCKPFPDTTKQKMIAE